MCDNLTVGKCKFNVPPMGLNNSPDIFQEKMSDSMKGLNFTRTHLDNLLVITKGSYEDHLEKLNAMLSRLKQAGLKVNAKKLFFAQSELECLGYWITREGAQPMPDKVKAMLNVKAPTTREELHLFIGLVNYY